MHTSMRALRLALLTVACIGACSGGGGGGGGQGAFRLIEFLDSNVAGIARNHVVTFLFSAPVDAGQNFPERLKIQSVEAGPSSDFTLAIGTYLISGDRVTFLPRLPNAADRSDTGFRADANYEVFLKAGPDGLASTSGDRIAAPQEFSFVTSQYFEDMVPGGPPRVIGLEARDPVTGDTTDIGRLDPRPTELALLDSAALISGVRFIDPAAGGPPDYPRAWDFVLHVSEPLDPLSVDTHSVEMLEIFSDATTSAADAPPDAPPGFTGNPVLFPVPLKVRTQQGFDANGHADVRIVVTPVYTLVDDTRYRLRFSGSIVGIDFRQQFIGVNGLTGDGETVISGSTPYPEPGGLGYTAEFIVRDRPAITSKRSLTYDPIVDGIDPELGQTTTNPNNLNSALYNPSAGPGTAVGYLAAFGNGTDGNIAVGTGTVTIDTGDTANAAVGKPFNVFDVNPINDYNANTLPGGTITYDSKKPFTLNLQSLTVSTGSTLKFIGVNPVLLRVTGVSQIAGTIDLAGQDGKNGLNGTVAGGL